MAKVMLLPLLAPREKTEVVNPIYQSTCAEKSHILPGGGAWAKTAQDESGKRIIWVMEIVWRAFHCSGYCSEPGPYQA